MTTQERIEERIDLVQNIFREVSGVPLEDSFEKLVDRLENETEPEFLSLAYESASYKIALGCLKSDMSHWMNYLENYAQKHAVQVYIGLGWAIARMGVRLDDLTEIRPEHLRYVADGCGFFYGTFKKQQALTDQLYHPGLEENACFFDEGLGRSLWYSSRGIIPDIKDTIDHFPEKRQEYLWRGIAIAFTYAGGFDKETIQSLIRHSGKFLRQVEDGVVSVARTRLTAGTVNEYTRLVCKEVCQTEVEELA